MELELRRRLLITRLMASIQSFTWSERAKRHEAAIMQAVAEANERLGRKEHVCAARIMAASQVSDDETKDSTSKIHLKNVVAH